MITEEPVVGTGMEEKAAVDSGVCVLAKNAGTVIVSSTDHIVIKRDEDGQKDEYRLTKFARSNQSNSYNQKPIISWMKLKNMLRKSQKNMFAK